MSANLPNDIVRRNVEALECIADALGRIAAKYCRPAKEEMEEALEAMFDEDDE